jgi:hypothetical protein
MDLVITYDMVKGLLANSASIGNRLNFFNLRALRKHFSNALKCIICPQSTVNGWSDVVLLPKMYTLVNGKPFKQGMSLKLLVLDFPPIYDTDGTLIIPYTQEQTLKITSEFTRAKELLRHRIKYLPHML